MAPRKPAALALASGEELYRAFHEEIEERGLGPLLAIGFAPPPWEELAPDTRVFFDRVQLRLQK